MSQPAAAPATTSQPGTSLLPDATNLLTTANFVLIAVLALLVVIGLIYGARLRRGRKQAREELVEHNEALRSEGVRPAPVAPTGDTTAAPAAPASPPPVDAPVPGMTAAREERVAPRPATPAPHAPAPGTPAPLPPEPLADEPIAAATPMTGENLAAEAAPTAPPAPAPDGERPADGPVTQLKGLGPRLAAKLAEEGITTVGQLAALDDDEAQALDARLGPFTGRMARDRWQEQARFLAAGDRAGFEAVFGRL